MSMLIDAEIVNVLILAAVLEADLGVTARPSGNRRSCQARNRRAAPVVTVRREVPQAVWAQC